MKIALTLLTSLLTISASATVLVVDPFGEPGTYPSFGLAMLQAANGDTIQVRPFTPRAHQITLDKDVTIIGHGYDLGRSSSSVFPVTYKGFSSRYRIRLNNGVTATLIGIIAEADVELLSNSTLYMRKCKVGGIIRMQDDSYLELKQSLVNNVYLFFSNQGRPVGVAANIINSHINNYIGAYDEHQIYDLYVSQSNIGRIGGGAMGSYINCIFQYQNTNYYPCNEPNRLIKHSILPNNVGEGCDSTNTFVGSVSSFAGACGYSLCDTSLYLIPNSPAIGAGYNGEDCGIFGGPTPYELSGLPSRPWIYDFITPPAVSQQSPAAVQVKVKAVD